MYINRILRNNLNITEILKETKEERNTSYLEVVFESFADHIQSYWVDARVQRRHVEADVVENKKRAKTSQGKEYMRYDMTYKAPFQFLRRQLTSFWNRAHMCHMCVCICYNESYLSKLHLLGSCSS